tara:strand:- start:87 stop:1619 length:1533 start_codon:yes stop_codon:yes gene_type:complete
MAFTKIAAAGIGSTETVTLHSLEVLNNATVGGVLTYEDVTNVDSVGLITARAGIVVGSGITLSKDGDGFFTGIVTATTFSGTFSGDGTSLTGVASTDNIRTNTNATFLQNVNVSGTVTATSYAGSGANLTGIDTDLVSDTSPQLGGDLASNGNDINFADNDKAVFGTGSDLKIYHNGTDNYVVASNGHIRFDTGSTELARITSGGDIKLNDDGEFIAGTSDDLKIYHTSNHSYIKNVTNELRIGSNYIKLKNDAFDEDYLTAEQNGAVELYYDNSKKFETSNSGATLTGVLNVAGGTSAYPVVSITSNDFVAKFESSDSTARLVVEDSNSTDNYNGLQVVGNSTMLICNNETGIKCVGDGATELYHDNSKKLETASGGVTVTGTVAATSYTGDGSNLTGIDAGIKTEAASISGITTYLDLTKDDHELFVSGTNTISVIGGAQGTSHSLRIQNSATANITLDSTYFKFPSGATPALPTASGAISMISFTVHKAGAVGVNTVLLGGASVSFS